MRIAFFGDSLTYGKLGVSYINIIKKEYPDFELLNFGKNGDTVNSLYKRIRPLSIDFKISKKSLNRFENFATFGFTD